MKIASVKGFRDVLPDEAAHRRRILDAAAAVLASYGYHEIELPLLEKSELFSRSVGTTSDIVEKEMYAFEDRDGTMVALRPEGTAAVARAYLQAGLDRSSPVSRFYYTGPMFRRERPQRGRFRQFTQIGAELIGRDDPASDVEAICLVADVCAAAGLAEIRIDVNALGDARCRPAHREALVEYASARIDDLCSDCRSRLDRNPLRLLDCKKEACRVALADAPVMPDYLCDDCRAHHERVLELLAATGVDVVASPRMVRGLDYYCRTAFEIVAPGLGAQDAVGGGGRYDGLVAALGGPDVAGVGFALGVERMQLAAGADEIGLAAPEMLVVPLEADAVGAALVLARRLRAASRRVELGDVDRKLKAQLRRADKEGIRYVIIIGEEELASGSGTLRDMVRRSDHPKCFALADPAADVIRSIERAGADEA